MAVITIDPNCITQSCVPSIKPMKLQSAEKWEGDKRAPGLIEH